MPIDKNFREEVRFVVALIRGSQSRRMGVNKATKTHDPLWVGQSHTMINRQIAFVNSLYFPIIVAITLSRSAEVRAEPDGRQSPTSKSCSEIALPSTML